MTSLNAYKGRFQQYLHESNTGMEVPALPDKNPSHGDADTPLALKGTLERYA